MAHNVAATIADVCGCIVWAPLVELTANLVNQVDSGLREFVESRPGRSVETYMRTARESSPIEKLYVRYGVCANASS